MPVDRGSAFAVIGDRLATGLVDVTHDLTALDGTGFWAVVVPFDAPPVLARFAEVGPARLWPGRPWPGIARDAWRTSLDEAAFSAGVEAIRAAIGRGDVYQVNLTRRLSAPLPPDAEVGALAAALAAGNPAPYAAVVHLPRHGVHVASASPELFLGRDGDLVWSSPIKGTAPTPDNLLPKDRAENVMIVDLVRNDLGRVSRYRTVRVPSLLARTPSRTRPPGEHRRGSAADWRRLGRAPRRDVPPGSVTGAPKISAVDHLRRLEPVPRGVYCGAVGWVDADRQRGELNVAIRTFWFGDGEVHLGTGGGITWDSTPVGEWAETELKAAHLLRVASGVLTPAR